MQKEIAHILIVEDDEVLSLLLEKGLHKAGHEVTGISDLRAALLLIKKNNYDLILLDINLPDGSGTQLLAQMRRAQNDTPIIVLSSLNDVPTKVLHLEVGADDFITKPFAFDELLARITVQLRRYQKPNVNYQVGIGIDEVLTVGKLQINVKMQIVTLDGRPLHFTPREFDVLVCLMRRKGEICSRQDLWEAMGEKGEIGKTSTLNVYIMYIRRKIGDDFEVKSIKKRGFVFGLKDDQAE